MRNGLLPMLERNMALKEAPERWQNNTCVRALVPLGVPCRRNTLAHAALMHAHAPLHGSVDEFDVVVAFEERVFDQIIDGTRAHAHLCTHANCFP
jgi:hypothetical protein